MCVRQVNMTFTDVIGNQLEINLVFSVSLYYLTTIQALTLPNKITHPAQNISKRTF